MGEIDSKKKLIELMNQYKNLVFSVCLKLTGDYFTAEDITQETFISAYQHLSEFDGQSEKAWLCRIASNKCVDYLRQAERRAVATAEEEMPQETSEGRDGPLEQFISEDVMERFRCSCNELPEPYKTPAILHFDKGLTAKEISEQTEVPIKTVQSQIYRAREMLKKKIRKEELLA
ncbi:MAG: RNA polymerase sigma factor [Butyrivibrio sp.]|nr:RNA polymerase sigma factor [Butyrivibrio sp.]